MNLTSTPNVEINDIYVNRKRHRRNKNEIIREFTCEHPGCLKSYGSEGSLNQHIKRKHHLQRYRQHLHSPNQFQQRQLRQCNRKWR